MNTEKEQPRYHLLASTLIAILSLVLVGAVSVAHLQGKLPIINDGNYWYSAPNGYYLVESNEIRNAPTEKGFPYKESWQGYGIISFPLCETASTQLHGGSQLHGEFRYTLNLTLQGGTTYMVNLQNDIIISATKAVTLT